MHDKMNFTNLYKFIEEHLEHLFTVNILTYLIDKKFKDSKILFYGYIWKIRKIFNECL